MLTRLRLITEQFFQVCPRRFFAGQLDFLGHPFAPDEFKILAEIAHGFFQHQIGAAFAALLRDVRIVALAVKANA